jgi:putative aldouronate transport system substrate-binding protein
MGKNKKLFSIVATTCILAGLMSACKPAPAAQDPTKTDTTTKAEETKTEETTAAEEPAAKLEKVNYVTPGNTFPDQDTALAEINKKLQGDGVNVEVSFTRIPWDGYQQKLNLMLSSGEEFDMLHVMQDIVNISALSSMDAIVPIDEYIQKYPGLVSKFTEDQWAQGKLKGKTYAVPAHWQEFSMLNGLLTYRDDVLKKVTDKFPTDFDGLFDVMQKMQAEIKTETGKTAYHWLHQVSDSPSWLHRTYDEFPFYVDRSNQLTLVKQDGTVESYFESDIFKRDAEAYRKMFKAGLIDPDVLNAQSQKKYDEMKVGATLPSATFSYNDEKGLKENIPSAELQISYLAPEKPYLQYISIQNLNAVSATSKNPEAPIKFLDWLYADKVNHDLFCYGVEGKHYTASAPDRIDFIRGEDKNALYAFDTWMIGYLPYMRWDEALPQKGIDYNTKAAPADKLVMSPVVGFIFDAANLKTELANLQAEVISSFYPIKYGLVDYDKAYPDAIKKLKAAGIDKYITEYQAQLKTFMGSK